MFINQCRLALIVLLLGSFGLPGLGRAAEPKKLAFVVGVSKYKKDGLNDLAYAEADIRDLSAELQIHGFKITSLTGEQATLAALNAKLQTFFDETKKLEKDDIVLLAFSGHGLQLSVTDPKRGIVETPFFCPIDALKTDPKTLLSLNWVMQHIDEDSASSQNLLIVDACRDNPAKGGRGVDGSTVRELPSKLSVLFGSSSGTQSYESEKIKHGIFTQSLLEGLRGGAADASGEITWLTLASYTMKRVKQQAPVLVGQPQRPNILGNLISQPSLAQVGVRSDNALGATLAWCPPGSFKLKLYDKDAGDVTLTQGFWMGQTSVTQAQWKAVMGDDNQPWSGMAEVKEGTDYPATYVSFDMCTEFINKLNAQEEEANRLPVGWRYSLPTSAQREYAARAGTTTNFWFGDDASQLEKYGWCDKNAGNVGEKYAHRVGQKPANPWKLYDMHGNVWDWCRDAITAAEQLRAGTDPLVAAGPYYVIRGGDYGTDASYHRAAHFGDYTANSRFSWIGFRIVLRPWSAGDLRSDNTLGMKFAWCPPGKFKMSNAVDVTLTQGFWMEQTSVTQAQWKAVMGNGNTPWSGLNDVKEGDDYPAVYVSFDQCTEFLKTLNAREQTAKRLPAGWHYALPTNAQREYATRAGTTTNYWFGDDGGQLEKYAWYDKNAAKVGEKFAHRVAQKPANPWQLYDMHGNVFDWCRDGWNGKPEKLPSGADPFVAAGPYRVVRGGDWSNGADFSLSVNFGGYTPDSRLSFLGFRVVLVQTAK